MIERKETKEKIDKYAAILIETDANAHQRELNILLNNLKDVLETIDNIIEIETGGCKFR